MISLPQCLFTAFIIGATLLGALALAGVVVELLDPLAVALAEAG